MKSNGFPSAEVTVDRPVWHEDIIGGLMNSSKRSVHFYNTSQAYYDKLKQHDEAYFRTYINLVTENSLHSTGKVLDLGCGTGISSHLLGKQGFWVVGVDISEKFLRHSMNKTARVIYLKTDALNLPLKDNSFDIVASHDFIEHVSDAQQALLEMMRLVKDDGVIILKCPNLLSPFRPIRYLFKIIVGERATPIWGESVMQAFCLFLKNILTILTKKLRRETLFLYREPLFDEEQTLRVSDLDASYLANPVDIKHFLKRNGFEIVPPRLSLLNLPAFHCILRMLLSDFISPVILVARRKKLNRRRIF